MADRYWILGTGTWSSTNTANWSASSGGAGGASVPTASDNVFFDANSNVGTGAFTVTMANTPRVCNDFTASGLDGVMTLAGTSIGLTVSGSLTFQATNFTRTYTGVTTFNATTTGKTVTTNGVLFGANVTFDGAGGGWTLGSAIAGGPTNTAYTFTKGTFDSGGYAITGAALVSTGVNSRTVNLNNSTITLGSNSTFILFESTGFTFNAGTSQINGTALGTNTTFSGGGLTYYNVAFTNTAQTTPSITGANTFNNLSITGRTTLGIGVLSLSADQTINGTLTVSAGTASAYRMQISSNTLGTTRTLTCAAVSLTDTDFRDITIAGAASPASGTRLGDCKGNSGIIFDAAKTVYYRNASSANWGGNQWSATSGGSPDATQFPLAQDTAVFPAATYPASGSTITINASYNIGTIDMSLRTSNTMTLTTSIYIPVIYGNWINGTGITISGTQQISFFGRTTQQITSAGRSFTHNIFINSPSGTVQLQDAFTSGSTSSLTLAQGTLDLQSYTLSTGIFASSYTTTRTIAFGTGQISCMGTSTVWSTATVTGLTTTGTQVVNVTSVGSTAIGVFPGALSQANSISFNFTGGTYALTFLAQFNYSARNVDFTGYAGVFNAIGVGIIIYGNLKFSTGMTLTATTNALTFGATSGTKQITTNAKTIDFPLTFNGVGGTFQLQDALTMGSTRTATLNNGTLDLNGKTLTVGTRFLTGTGTKNLTFNGGTLVCPDPNTTSFNNNAPTNFTTTAGTGTGTISMTAATAKTFVGGGSTFNCTLNQGGAGTLTIEGSNTFSNITNTYKSTGATSILFTAGTTSTFADWNASGESTRLLTIGSVTAASHTLSKSSGTVSSDFLSISRSTATGGAGWYAGANSTDGGNNSGWIFTAPPAPSAGNGNFLVFF